MARLPRLALDGLPHHLIQRGNNWQPIVAGPEDAALLADLLLDGARELGVALHAFIVMPEHFHALATPAEAAALSAWMQGVGRRYVRHFNLRQQRSGTLWDGRFRSTVLQPGLAVLACMVAMDSNPVRRGLVQDAAEHPAGSHRHYAGLQIEKRLSTPEAYWTLGNTPFAREDAYAQGVRSGLEPRQLHDLMRATNRGWAWGDAAFVAQIQAGTSRPLKPRRPGRHALSSLSPIDVL